MSGGTPLAVVRGILREGGCEIVTCPSFDPDRPHLAEPVGEVIQLLAETDVVLMAGSGNPIDDRALPDEPIWLRGVVTSSLGFARGSTMSALLGTPFGKALTGATIAAPPEI